MAITGKLGTPDSYLGNISLGFVPSSGGIIIRDINESITLTEGIINVKVIIRNVSETIHFTELPIDQFDQFINESLVLLETLTNQPYKAITETLNLAETIVLHYNLSRNISEGFYLRETARGKPLVPIIANIHDDLFLREVNLITKIYYNSINESINLVETKSVTNGPITYISNISESINLIETITKLPGPHTFTNLDRLVIIEAIKAGVTYSKFTGDRLHFNEALLVEKFKSKNISESINLVETLTFQRSHNQSISESINFSESLITGTSYLINIYEILPLMEGYELPLFTGDQAIAMPALLVAVKPKKCNVYLSSTLRSSAIILPCPQMGDTQSNLDQQIVKRSMNGKLRTYVRKSNLQKLNYTFVMGTILARQLEDFVDRCIDDILNLTNWKGELWKVQITTNPVEFSPKSLFLNEGERFEVSLEFQGIRLI